MCLHSIRSRLYTYMYLNSITSSSSSSSLCIQNIDQELQKCSLVFKTVFGDMKLIKY